MSNTPYVGRIVRSFITAPEFDGFSKVVIVVTDELEYAAGTDTGRTLSLVCPWGTQAMANNILKDIKGYKYHPYSAAGAYLDPSSEIGDGVTVNGIYSGIYTMDVNFGSDCRADISAPAEEEIDHEYPYVPKQERTVNRKFSQIESEFKVQADQISAKVSKTGGSNQSFGWDLDEKSWTLKSKNKTVLLATENGVEITGKITVTSGKIGGFDIESNYLSYNGQTWKGTNARGAYIGTNGIQLGKNFRVDMSGNLYAASGEFSGSVKAANIKYGGSNGYFNGGGIASGSIYGGSGGAIAHGTLSTFNMNSGINSTLDHAEAAYDVLFRMVKAAALSARSLAGDTINGTSIYAGKLYLGGMRLYLGTVTDIDGSVRRVVQWYS